MKAFARCLAWAAIAGVGLPASLSALEIPQQANRDCGEPATCADPQAAGYARLDAERFELRRVVPRCIRAPCPSWHVIDADGASHRVDVVWLAPGGDEAAVARWRQARESKVRVEGAAWVAPDGRRAVVRIDRADVAGERR